MILFFFFLNFSHMQLEYYTCIIKNILLLNILTNTLPYFLLGRWIASLSCFLASGSYNLKITCIDALIYEHSNQYLIIDHIFIV